MSEVINDAGTTVFDVANDPDFQDSGATDTLFEGAGGEAEVDSEGSDDAGNADGGETTPDAGGDDAVLAEILKQLGVENLNDPKLKNLDVGKLLKQMADKEKHIRTLKQQGDTAKEPEIDWTEGLNLPKEKAQEKLEEKPAEPKPAEEEAVDDIGKDWKAPVDAVKDENEAFSNGEFEKVAAIRKAAMLRHMSAIVLPHFKALQDRLSQFEQKYGDVTRQTQQTLERQYREEDQGFAIESLKKSGMGDAVEALFAPAADGETVEFQGQKFPATWYNRIVAENPELLNIQVQDENPRIAARKTYAARYKAAARMYQAKNQQEPKKAMSLVKAGRDLERRQQETERVRHSLNAGKGATTTTGKPRKDYAREVMDATSDDFNVLDKLW